jgi:hypothetical protein
LTNSIIASLIGVGLKSKSLFSTGCIVLYTGKKKGERILPVKKRNNNKKKSDQKSSGRLIEERDPL